MGCGFCESALSVGTLLVGWVAKPAGRQFGYLYHFDHNVQQLRRKRDELQIARDQLERKIHVAENQLLQIGDDVRNLLSEADDFLRNVETMEMEIGKNKRCFAWCPNCWWRYRLSKNLAKKEVAISQLLEKINNQPGQLGYPSTSTVATIEFLSSSKDFIASKASQEASKQIKEALKDDNVSLIGLWGMGGSGKTTLARELGIQAEKSNLFDKVVFATVSQTPNSCSIQDEIAKYLDDFNMDVEGRRRSAQELWLRLQKEKKILIILDDVWKVIQLKGEIGIPLGDDHKGCKVLLTTRSLDTCHRMECQRAVQVGVLDYEEAWKLFEMKADLGNSIDDIKEVAGQIVQKCEGLPIALVTLGSALKGNTNLHRWKVTCGQLRERRLDDIEGIDQNAYRCLEVSFNYLKEMETKMCFLLCSLFPEDHEIYVEDLVRYAWGLELYRSVNSVEDVRSKVLAAVDILKSSSLLLDSGERHVKMHDLVRDVALRIASGGKDPSFSIKSEVVESWREDERFEPYTAMFFKTHSKDELPKGLICPNLKILLLLREYGSDCSLHERLIAPETSEFQPKLQTLQLERWRLLDISILEKLTNLRTLHLEWCSIRPEISVVGKLKKLQVLSFSGSDIKELPKEIGDLNNLKLLDLSYCKYLQRIPSHLIQRLSKLEELYLHGCESMSWATENTTSDEMYASLLELTSLQKLTILSLEVALIHLPKGFVFQGLQRYNIHIRGDVLNRPDDMRAVRYHAKRISQNYPIMTSLRIEVSGIDACKHLFQKLETLHLENLEGRQNFFPSVELELDQQGFNKLTSLGLESCKSMKCLVDATKPNVPTAAFSNLVDLSLSDLVELEELCKGQQPQRFLEKLKTLRIYKCPEMIGAIPMLQNLETLRVTSCDKIQVLFQTIELGCTQALNRHESLKCLKVVEIYECNNLSYLFPATVANSLGQLETLEVRNCSVLKEIIQKTEVMSNISLQSLRDVCIEGCNNLTSLSSLSYGHFLANLKNLAVDNCSRLQYTFPTSMAKSLPQLNQIRLENLPQLKGRDENDIVLMLPSLQELSVKDCPQFISFEIQVAEMGSAQQMLTRHVSFKSLKFVHIHCCNTWLYLFPAVVANSLGRLEDLLISDCSELEEIIQQTEASSINLQSLKFVKIFSCNKLRYLFPGTIANSLGQLETLQILYCSEMKEIIQGMEVSNINLQSLREVHIEGCDNLTSLSSLSHGHILKNLKKLDIFQCSLLEYTFPTSMAERLPQLNEIRLEGLPQLKGRDGNDIVLTLPSLQVLRVTICPQLTPFIISAKIQELHLGPMTESEEMGNMRMVPEFRGRSANMEYLTITNFQDHLFDAAFNLSSLKKITLWALPQLQVVWKGPIQFVSFQNLIDLDLYYCEKLRYIFSSPIIAQNLPQLSSLSIDRCDELERIIDKDETSSQAICFANLTSIRIVSCKNMKSLLPVGVAYGLSKLKQLNLSQVSNLENVFEKGDEADVSDDKEKVIHLPQLGWLKLKDLPKLKTFSPMAHHFVLPSLRELEVTSCPNISTRFSVDSKKWGYTITESETIRSIDENIVEDSATTHQTTWPVSSDIQYFPEDY